MPDQSLSPISKPGYEKLAAPNQAPARSDLRTESNQDLLAEVNRLRAMVDELQHQTAELATVRQALEAERRRYREMFELAPDAYLLTSLDGVIREANRAAAAMLSMRQDALPGKSIFLFMDDEARTEVEAKVAPWHRDEPIHTNHLHHAVRGQISLRVYKGASFPADYTVSPARDGHGQIIGLRWILRDLSENTRTEQALRERDYHFRTLFDHAGDAIFIHNLTGRFLEVNHVVCKSLGYTREELLSMTPADIVAPEMAGDVPKHLARLRRDEYLFLETVLKRKDGTRLPVEVNSRLFEYAGGQAVLGIARDITERNARRKL